MVKYGLFGLGFVRTEPNEEIGEFFEEHCSPVNSSDIYAEVEPEAEYYIHLLSDATEVVYADLRVDGTLIEEGCSICPGETKRFGIYHRIAGTNKGTENALIFAKTKVYRLGAEEAPEYWTGQVEVTFFGNPIHRILPDAMPEPYTKAGPNQTAKLVIPESNSEYSIKYRKRKSIVFTDTNLSSSTVGYIIGKSAAKQGKGVKSAEGKTTLRDVTYHEVLQEVEVLKGPEKLGTIILRYCSTIGLIHVGILAKPPLWENLRMKGMQNNNRRKDDWKALSEAKVIKYELKGDERINNEGEKYSTIKIVDLFDLTNESND